MNGRPWTKADDGRLIAMVRNGAALTDVSHALGRSWNSVTNRAKRLGVQFTARRNPFYQKPRAYDADRAFERIEADSYLGRLKAERLELIREVAEAMRAEGRLA
jgi:hypothetical protein